MEKDSTEILKPKSTRKSQDSGLQTALDSSLADEEVVGASQIFLKFVNRIMNGQVKKVRERKKKMFLV